MLLAVITKRGSFLKARDEGKFFATYGFAMQAIKWRENEQAEINFGITATKKIGNAVARNRAKRRLREIARSILSEAGKEGFTYVLIAKSATLSRDYAQLQQDLKYALDKIHN